MQVPFSGFEVPSLVYLLVLLAGLVTVVALLYATRPPLTQRTVLAFVPWVASGAALHVFYQLGASARQQVYPVWAEPLFAAPAVYVTAFVLMGVVWLVAVVVGTAQGGERLATRYLGVVGTGVLIALVGLLVWQSLSPVLSPRPIVPLLTLIGTAALTFVVYVLIGTWRAWVLAEARLVGGLVLFAHLLDGVSTAVAVDVFGTTERSLVPARIMEFAGTLPTESALGTGWLFVAVKLVVAALIVVAFADYVREEPVRGNLLFAAVIAVGLGPAMNNLFITFLGL
jgi:Predicted membrane protein